jgi:lipoprotein-anchoring transpeptidase ErfK/SrfK
VLRTELGTAKKVGERTLWFDRDLTDEESTKVADMQAAIENQEAIIREAKASLGDIPAGGGTPAAGGTPGDGSDIRGKILNDQGDGAGEPPPSPAENGAAAAILGKLGSADLDIVPEPRDASAYEPKPWVQAGTTPVDLLIGAGKAFVGDEEQKELERDIARHELWRHSRRTAGPKRITYGGGQARNPNVPGAAAGAVSGDPRPVIPLAFENPDSVPEDIDPQYASIPSRFMRPGIPETMTDATDQPVDLDVNYLDIVSRLMRPGIPLAAHQEGELPEDVSISQADLPMEGRQFGPPEPRPSVPISMDSGGDLLPDDIQLAYVDMGLDQMRPEIAFQLRDFDPQPVDSKISDVDLPLPTMAVDMLKETEEVVPGSLLSDGTSLVALDVLQKHSKPNGKIQVIIDLNTNSATVMRGHELVTQYPVASGDITGTVQGKPTYTPSGETQIYTESPYDTYEQSGRDNYGPYWMSLYDQSKPKAGQHFAGIGMHGPYYEDKKVFDEEGNFLNEGRLSAGCIRFKVEDLIDLSNHVETGTRVFIMPLRGENGTDTRTARAGDTPADGPAPQAR